ncbi:MAG: dihydrolipoamide acetyltransferase [Myxococcales bacterium]|nr:dihydrolipoamide acetyltransferase [Myxococcales bacterium]MCB9734522.1 dihydrolipoamide acetyltransferase [Deltaproteobacteria bacterium]
MTSPLSARSRWVLGALGVVGLVLTGGPGMSAEPTPDAPPAPADGMTPSTSLDAPPGTGDGETTPAPTGGPTAGAGVGTVGAELHDAKLRELEEQVIGLKEKVFRSKTRLLLLKERILNDVIAEAKVVIFHENDMGASFKPVQVLYHLDGEKIYFQDDTSRVLDDQDSIEIFNQNLVPGNHVLAVEMIYRGDSAIFPYLKDYLFKLRANYTFFATKGKITTVRAIGYQRGDITYDLRERPSIQFDVKQVSYTNEDAAAPTATSPAPTTPAPEEGKP